MGTRNPSGWRCVVLGCDACVGKLDNQNESKGKGMRRFFEASGENLSEVAADIAIHIIPSNYKTERAEANELLASDSELIINEFETASQKWFELGKEHHRKAGFLKIPYLRTTFTSTLEMKEPEKC